MNPRKIAIIWIVVSTIISLDMTSLTTGRPYLIETTHSVGITNNAPEMVVERSVITLLTNYSISMIRVFGRLFKQRTHDCCMSREYMEPLIKISTTVQTYEDPEKIIQSIKIFFPDFKVKDRFMIDSFPTKNKERTIIGESSSLEYLLNQIRIQRILDTSLDVMTLNLDSDSSYFYISRQAAMAKKVSFVLDEKNLGGNIRINISGEDIDLWLEQQTWHEGRNEIPRFAGDELTMRYDGNPTEWFDKRGQPTINIDKE